MRFVFEDFELDRDTLELCRAGEPVAIGAQPLSLILHLVENRDRVVSREELLEVVWRGTAIGETSLGQSIRRARLALDDDGRVQRFIRNVRGIGYRFVAAVDESSTPARGRPDPGRTAHPGAESAPACFGRARELAALNAALDATRRGEGDVVWLSGEEGIGKTRLIEAFAHEASSHRALVLRASCAPGPRSSPFGPFVSVIEATRRLAVAAPSWSGPDAALLDRISALGVDSPPAGQHDRPRLFEAVAGLLARLAAEGPTVVMLDDLHHADATTHALVHAIAGRAVQDGWLLVGAMRDGEPGDCGPRLDALRAVGSRRAPIRLAGLEADQTARLLASVAGRPLPAAFCRRLHAQTGGNPFFSREILRSLLEEGSLVDERGEWQEEPGPESGVLPVGVRDVLSRRLAGLDPAAGALLAVASAEPGVFHFEVVRLAAQLDETAALDGLEDALEARIIESTDDAEMYRFCNDLTRRVLYQEHSPARCVRLHRRLAEAHVDALGPRASEHAERIARHYLASAGLAGAEAGVPHCLIASDRAAAVAAWEDEAELLRIALHLLPTGDERRFAILQRFSLALAFSGDTSEAARVAAEVATLVDERKGRHAAAAYLVNVVSGVAWGASQLAFDLSRRARGLVGSDHPLTLARLRLLELWRDAEKAGHPLDTPDYRQATLDMLDNWSSLEPARKNGLALVGLAFESRAEVLERAADTAAFLALWAGEYEAAIGRFRDEVAAAANHTEVSGSYFYLCTIARLHAALGHPEPARQAFAESERLFAGLPSSGASRVVRASMHSGLAQLEGCGHAELLPLFEEAIVGLDEGAKWMLPTAACVGAEVYARAGHREDAIRLLELGLPGVVRSPGWMTTYTLIINSAIGALWVLGSNDWTKLLEKQLREKTLEPDFRFPSTDARLSMARLCTLDGRYDEAESWFAEARRVLDAQGARPLRAIADLDEARMLGCRGAPGDARRRAEKTDEALAAFRQIGMPGWIAQVEALRRDPEVGGPKG